MNITNTMLFFVDKIKCENHILSTKSNSVFAYVVSIFLMSCLNDDVKLTKI